MSLFLYKIWFIWAEQKTNCHQHVAFMVIGLHNMQRIAGERSSQKHREIQWGSRNVDHVPPNWVNVSADSLITLEQSRAQSRAASSSAPASAPVAAWKKIKCCFFSFSSSFLVSSASLHYDPWQVHWVLGKINHFIVSYRDMFLIFSLGLLILLLITLQLETLPSHQ